MFLQIITRKAVGKCILMYPSLFNRYLLDHFNGKSKSLEVNFSQPGRC